MWIVQETESSGEGAVLKSGCSGFQAAPSSHRRKKR